jgi:hypothetical protein
MAQSPSALSYLKSKYHTYDLSLEGPAAKLPQFRGIPQGVDVVRKRPVQREGEVRQVPIESIRLSRFNARRALDGKNLNELSSSIEQHGLIEPVILRPQGRAYEVVAGTRRFLAARKAGIKAITALVRTLSDSGRFGVREVSYVLYFSFVRTILKNEEVV